MTDNGQGIMRGPGLIALLGSGETTASGGQLFDTLAQLLPSPLKVAVMETPAGFELNSDLVAGRVADFIKVRLQNYHPDVRVIPARKRGTPYSPDDPQVLTQMLDSHMIYLGAGSPTYAVRQLQNSLAWDYLQARHRLGAAVVLASAAAIATGDLVLPVYEIFKVGEDPHWKNGLEFFKPFGLSLVVVSHWNNTEGGADLDTSRCFVGRARFDPLLQQVPASMTVLGLDELTGIIIDLRAGTCQVIGRDSIHILRSDQEREYCRGDVFALRELGDYFIPDDPSSGISSEAWQAASEAHEDSQRPVEINVPDAVQDLVDQRQEARTAKNWNGADELRKEIAEMGWKVIDTPEGPKVEPDKQ